MKPSPYRARVHLYVCANQRPSEDPLGSGCGDRGEVVFHALKKATRGTDVWVTKTHCIGLCPKHGCSVMIAPAMQYFTDVEEKDVDAIVSAAR